MQIAILSRNPDLYSTRRLFDAGSIRGHQVRVIDTLRCYMNISTTMPSVHYQGEGLTDFDAVIPRIGASITAYGAAVVRQFERIGVYSLNSANSITLARDKLRTLQVLAEAGLPLPRTGFADAQEDIADLITLVGGAPLIVKLLDGTQGIGVVLAESQQSATSVIEAFYGLRANILIQEFIGEADGADIRCFVVGGRVIASMKRQARAGEFRANLHRGGTATPVRISRVERSMAIKSARVLGLSVAGVDLIRSRHGPMIMEVNASPGLEGIETATKKDIAGAIFDYLERQVMKNQGK